MKPRQPRRILAGLKTNFNLSPSYTVYNNNDNNNNNTTTTTTTTTTTNNNTVDAG